jgi:alkyldihydroxyacetonephosphate synthase
MEPTDHAANTAPKVRPPNAIRGGAASAPSHLGAELPLPPDFLQSLVQLDLETVVESDELAEAGRDWWPLAMVWATEGRVPARAYALVRPRTAEEVAAVYRLCSARRVPVTPIGGRSGVMGASVPVRGGVLLDTTAMAGIVGVDVESGLVTVLPGTFGAAFEEELSQRFGLTVGHWPQSMDLSTIGGWVACRGAGQLSTRYGKIEDLVEGLTVVLPDGSTVTTGGFPKAAVGPDLSQLFTGAEGTLGTIVSITLRARPLPAHFAEGAWTFASFEAGLEVMRRVSRRSATPAVFRLYDEVESARSFSTGPGQNVLIVRDEGEPALVDATMSILAEECANAISEGKAASASVDLVSTWLDHRNDVSALERLIDGGYVVDTMEVSAPWSRLAELYQVTTETISAVPGVLVASAHQSHSYLDGGCLYFTFAAKPELADRDARCRTTTGLASTAAGL